MANSHHSNQFEAETLPLSEQALLDAGTPGEPEGVSLNNGGNSSSTTICCPEDTLTNSNYSREWNPKFTVSIHGPSTHNSKRLKCWNYLRRNRVFLISVSLCLLAWIIFSAVTLYTIMQLQFQCGIHSHRQLNPRERSGSKNVSRENQGNAKDVPSVCTTYDCVTTAARMLNAMDFSVDPCHDFFNYACAKWNKEHIIPEDRTSISTFEVMADNLQVQLRRLLEESDGNGTAEAMKKAKRMWASCMNVSQIEQIGDKPLRDLMARFGGWPVIFPSGRNGWTEDKANVSVEELIAILHRDLNIVIAIDQWVGPDDKDSEKHILQIDQPDLALPSRDHYLLPQWKKDLEAYLLYMVEVARIFGASTSTTEKQLRSALNVEISLANASSPESERQATRSALYNKMTLAELQQVVPNFDWAVYFRTFLGYELNSTEEIVAYGLPYLKAATSAIKRANKRDIWNYALWRVAMEFTPHLSSAYLDARANFHRVLMGVSQQRARWQQCIDFVNEKMGMATGALFIREHFQPESKDKALEMIHMIREAFVSLMDEQSWMDERTAAKAKEKGQFMNEKIGYPNFLLNATALNSEYESLVVDDSVFMINVARLHAFQTRRNVERLRLPVDPERWTTTGPAIVNAFYNPNKNDIVFPAGILQPPFYSASYPRSMNFGGIGVVVGHEISHGFDMKGRQFDRYGNLKEWWNNATAEAFYKKAECFVEQYASYIVDEVGLHIDGRLTLGENIADNGGLKQAYRAYKKWLERNGPEPLLPGSNLTHDQLFFLNYAQIWCGSMRIQDAMNKISASVHSPGPIRVLGPLSNMPEFSKAFNCPVGSRYNPPPEKRCSLW